MAVEEVRQWGPGELGLGKQGHQHCLIAVEEFLARRLVAG